VAFAYLGKLQPLRRRFERMICAKFIRAPKLATAEILLITALAIVLLPGVQPRVLAQNAIRTSAQKLGINPAPLESLGILQNLDGVLKAERTPLNDSRDSDPIVQSKSGQSQPKLPGNPQNNNPLETVTDGDWGVRSLNGARYQSFRNIFLQYIDRVLPSGSVKFLKEEEERLDFYDRLFAKFYAGNGDYAGYRSRLQRILGYHIYSRVAETNRPNETSPEAGHGSQLPQKNDSSEKFREYYQWLDEDVAYIISQEEKNAFLALRNDQERRLFIDQFWAQRPASFKEEHYRRLFYAGLHFATNVPGWETDRGRIYILYGKPDEIESYPLGRAYGTVRTFPYEKWSYRHVDGVGDDITIEFVDSSWSGDYRMAMSPDDKVRH
jgi:GWxTD domain-containing protein